MYPMAQLRKFFAILLVSVVLFTSTAFSVITQPALAKSGASNEVSNVKGSSSNVNQSYHKLQAAAHDYRQAFRDSANNGKNQPPITPGNNPKQAAKNISKNARGAFGRTIDAVKETLNPD